MLCGPFKEYAYRARARSLSSTGRKRTVRMRLAGRSVPTIAIRRTETPRGEEGGKGITPTCSSARRSVRHCLQLCGLSGRPWRSWPPYRRVRITPESLGAFDLRRRPPETSAIFCQGCRAGPKLANSNRLVKSYRSLFARTRYYSVTHSCSDLTGRLKSNYI